MMNGKLELRYLKYSQFVLAVVFLLILVGGIVRTTGSGMGCPDWPKCFGLWVPPTCSCELPANYREDFAKKRIEKNKRVAKIFRALGNEQYANEIVNHPIVAQEQAFNVWQTWTEYINRLIGVITGLLIGIQFILSVRYFRKVKPWLVVWSLLAVLITGFQAFLGSLVVSTNLNASMLNAHFFLAFAIAVLVAMPLLSQKSGATLLKDRRTFWFFGLLLVVATLQIALGTEVRIGLKSFLGAEFPTVALFEKIGLPFFIHRTGTLLLLVLSILILRFGRNLTIDGMFLFWLYCIPSSIILQGITGVGMVYGGLAAWGQMFHVLFASLFFVSVTNVLIRAVILRR
jgi:cytochrome c oxidase assembly protein subunit 15